ncbi:acetyl-CoA C-acetyltransferase [Actinomadura sp. 7K507]|uniref:acetyl-CoA C-acetyltransferase n=1 Tax=Actinomadura sp. 7K507 TaxID=2530365 RepID=UPI00104A2922|nr:acetyl-CoA C-acetyltransferase [Actinomadura sp. 7K507]TDC86406.1 acetyl-CoA C-acyltransferase [Actinomadura sp. 7K507]
MNDAVICQPVRTAIGRFGGALRTVPVQTLGVTVVEALMARSGLDGALVDDVVFGHCYGTAEAPALGRVVALDAGLPTTVPGMQLDRRCGSGLQAVVHAAAMVRSGTAQAIIAGGAENMSQAPHYSLTARWGSGAGDITLTDTLTRGRTTAGGRSYPVPGGMLETAENLRREYSISREDQDELAYQSHQRALDAQDRGAFADEIVPVKVGTRKGEVVVDTDEHPRRDISREALAGLRAVMRKQDDGATVTAGNASGQNDGAAACLVTTPEFAAAHGLRPLARVVSMAVAGVSPGVMGIGPVPATRRALDAAGLKLADMDLIELNEAFAAQALAVTREWGFGAGDFERLNVNGSGISLGHPVGATGARIVATLLHEMARRDARYGLETLCIGGGQGIAAVFERVQA